jgi:hypothetical protein
MTIFVAVISFFSNGVPRYQSCLLPSSFMTIFVAVISSSGMEYPCRTAGISLEQDTIGYHKYTLKGFIR